MVKLVKLTFALSVLYCLTSFGLLGLMVQTYSRLTFEEPIATVTFVKTGEMEFEAHLQTRVNAEPEVYPIRGDQWEIGADFVKLKPWANVLGLDAYYKLDRFAGRYSDIVLENTQPRVAYDLSTGIAGSVPDFLMEYNFFADTEYGSGAYAEIDVSTRYTVYRDQRGLFIRRESIANDSEKPEGLWEKATKLLGIGD
ncbi:hypothetical protein [Kordiimonas gwangyangensis]|uniref:hypothetical protein n=1 Tax=Kordiimonas gwangyangensis TaxID=288022 RepID=UPI00036D79DB|nr:hypothetical protein [Kordiimonas gwangyangensis]